MVKEVEPVKKKEGCNFNRKHNKMYKIGGKFD